MGDLQVRSLLMHVLHPLVSNASAASAVLVVWVDEQWDRTLLGELPWGCVGMQATIPAYQWMLESDSF